MNVRKRKLVIRSILLIINLILFILLIGYCFKGNLLVNTKETIDSFTILSDSKNTLTMEQCFLQKTFVFSVNYFLLSVILAYISMIPYVENAKNKKKKKIIIGILIVISVLMTISFVKAKYF